MEGKGNIEKTCSPKTLNLEVGFKIFNTFLQGDFSHMGIGLQGRLANAVY